MGWEHLMAKELRKRDNRSPTVWSTGQVLSPTVKRDPNTGEKIYEGPLIVSCADGAVMLQTDRLWQLPTEERYHEGQTVALLGDLFGGAGSQMILILGEVSHAI